MKTLVFNYTKADGTSSHRVLAVSNEPSKNFAGTDISALDTDNQVDYLMAVNAAKNAYLEALKSINDKFDLTHNYRQFKPENMSNVVSEYI